MINIDNISFKYDDKYIYEGFSLKLYKGNRYAIFANNGVGKTTLLNLISGNLRVNSGKIESSSDDVMLIESPNIPFKFLSGMKFIKTTLELKNLVITDDSIIETAEILGLKKEDLINKNLESYSKGMTFKVLMIIALKANPDILLLDEPFSELDLQSNEILSDIFSKNKRQTFVFSTHVIEIAQRYATHLILIDDNGKLVGVTELGEGMTPEEIQSHINTSFNEEKE